MYILYHKGAIAKRDDSQNTSVRNPPKPGRPGPGPTRPPRPRPTGTRVTDPIPALVTVRRQPRGGAQW